MTDWLPPESGKCFACGKTGHLQADCPGQTTSRPIGVKPVWCGECDKLTRLVEFGDHIQRCVKCHPLRYQTFAQHERCVCGKVRYAWDRTPCAHPQHAGLRVA